VITSSIVILNWRPIIEFDAASDYMRALESDSTLAIVPFQLAADAWGVSRAAIDGMAGDGRLAAVRISGTRYVRASSLTALMSGWDDEVARVRKAVEKHARNGEVVIYEPLMTPLGMKTTVPADRKRIGAVLGEISTQTI
jgi:hypothetical protein